MEFRISPRQVGLLAVLGSAVFTLLHLLVQGLRFALDDHSLFGALTMFSLGSDRNFPTLFATVLILSCAALLAATGRASQRSGLPWLAWYLLSMIFLFLAADEILEIHERLIDPMRGTFGASGLLYYAWVIPYGVATLVFVLVFGRFLLRLPARSRYLFVLAGGMYVAGALGMEMLGGAHSSVHGNANVTYVAYQTVEEVLELTGMSLFLYALADHLARAFGAIGLRLAR